MRPDERLLGRLMISRHQHQLERTRARFFSFGLVVGVLLAALGYALGRAL